MTEQVRNDGGENETAESAATAEAAQSAATAETAQATPAAQEAADVSTAASPQHNPMDDQASEDIAPLAEEILARAPQSLREIIPAELSKAKQALFVLRAEQSGAIKSDVAETDGARRAPVTPPRQDIANMNPTERMASGYKR